MGISRQYSFIVLNHMALGDAAGISESLREKVLAYQGKRRRFNSRRSSGGVVMMRSRSRARSSILMKRHARVDISYSKPQKDPIERKVRTLKKLIPSSTETMSLDGLFMQTADYILALEMRVKVMQILVKALTGCDQ